MMWFQVVNMTVQWLAFVVLYASFASLRPCG